ncbi:MAG: YdcF family protein [Pseudomonadota bacterium]|nr:YdcF family protein [Pseudomonadota bacterium]
MTAHCKPSPAWLLAFRATLTVLGLLLAAHALWLMTRGLMHLGVVLPLLGGLVLAAGAWRWPFWRRRFITTPARRRVARGLFVLLALGLLVVAAGFTVIARASNALPDGMASPSAIVVLGSGTPDCKPSAVLQARLDRATELARRWPAAWVLSSGGPDWGRQCTEGRVMADALRAAGLPPHRLLTEEASTSTEANLRLSRPVLAAHGVAANAPVIIVTSDFHAPRALRIARRAGYAQAMAAGAPTPLDVRYNAWLRELFAVASGWLLGEY